MVRPDRRSERETRSRADEGRAQTTADYVIGVSLFLLAVGSVFAFLPGLVEPETGSGDTAQVAARAGGEVADDLLGAPDRPGVLNETCTERFFNTTQGPEDCPWGENIREQDNENLSAALGVSNYTYLNVSVIPNATANGTVSSLQTPRGRTNLTIGRPLPDDSVSVVSVRRAVLVDGTVQQLRVRAW
jgi:hypothetical protein